MYLAYSHGVEHERGTQAREEVLAKSVLDQVKKENQDWADKIGTKVSKALGNIRIENTTVNNEVRHEREVQTRVLDNPDCAVPGSTLRLLNRARGHVESGEGVGGGDSSRAREPAGGMRADGKTDGEAARGAGPAR